MTRHSRVPRRLESSSTGRSTENGKVVQIRIYLNIPPNQVDRRIYRITTLERVKQLCASMKNTLVKPRRWEDPYENFILRSRVKLKSGEIVDYNYHDRMYGQCWTLHSTSDAMWRIYAPDKRGVRMRSTIATLAASLSAAHPNQTEARCRIGLVRYVSRKAIDIVADQTFDDYGVQVDDLFSTLLVKRFAFKHEREIRLLYCEIGDAPSESDLYHYDVDPHTIVDQIMLDPRLSVDEAHALRDDLRESTGFRGPIKRSLLYTPPKQRVLPVVD